MNALSHRFADFSLPLVIDGTDGVFWTDAGENRWTVTVDGTDSRTITKDGTTFIAWIGVQERCWSFQRALRACAEHVRYCREMEAEATAKREQAIASLMSMTPAQKRHAVENLQRERESLEYADAHVDVAARRASIDKQIAALGGRS